MADSKFCSNTGSFWFQTVPSPERNHFLVDLLAAESASKTAVEPATNSKQTLAWNRYQQYIKSIAITSDPFLDNFTKSQRVRILGAFAHAIRENRFSSKKSTFIKSGSC